jgi:hypothetical protein
LIARAALQLRQSLFNLVELLKAPLDLDGSNLRL